MTSNQPMQKFCSIFPLETAGIFIACFGLVSRTISLIMVIPIKVISTTYSCEDLKEIFEEDGIHFDNCATLKTVLYIAVVLVCIFFMGFVMVDLLLIQGTRQRNPSLLLPAVVLYALHTVLYLLLIFTNHNLTSLTAVLFALIYGYFTMCLYSLYMQFRQEKPPPYDAV